MAVSIAKKTHFILMMLFFTSSVFADLVKPALIEINVDTKGNVDIEIRASVEALLTGINGRFKNTQDSPNADAYDVLRKKNEDDLAQEFDKFKDDFLSSLKLTDSNKKEIVLDIINVKIPEPGYTKVPRISLITLSGKVDLKTESLQWFYPAAFGDNAVRLKQVDAKNEKWHWSDWQWIRKNKPSDPFSLTEIVTKQSIIKTITSYVGYGFVHILPSGLDHILFILGLFLFAAAFKPLLMQITIFTLAHTITLGLAVNGMIDLPAKIVEPLIALSIAYIGIENIFANIFNYTLQKNRLLLVFLFGLVHGLGFASWLQELGMPDDAFITALISFNVGVELGQLTVILIAFLLVGMWFRNKTWYRKIIVIPASLTISLVAIYWFIDRLELGVW